MPVGWPTRLAAEGVKPLVVPRWTLYRRTPTLSVDAVQETFAKPAPPVALGEAGVVGAVTSGSLTPEVVIIELTDGTPFVSTIQSM